MSLLTRLVAPLEGETKLPVHQFTAGIAEYRRGEMSGAEMASRFGLSPTEITALNNWLAAIDSGGQSAIEVRTETEDVLMLGESGIYSLAEVQTRLGL